MQKIKKTSCVCKKCYFSNPAICRCKNGIYLGSIGKSVVIYDEIIDTTKTIQQKVLQQKLITQKLFKQRYYNKFLYFISLFINYHSIISTCWYLTYKTSIKTKTVFSFYNSSKLKNTPITNI